jgi:hypothetical protein
MTALTSCVHLQLSQVRGCGSDGLQFSENFQKADVMMQCRMKLWKTSSTPANAQAYRHHV